jgi:hypothetical protein
LFRSHCVAAPQQLYSTPGGSRFLQLHKVNRYMCPYVAIIDPRTGQNVSVGLSAPTTVRVDVPVLFVPQLWNHSGAIKKDDFMDEGKPQLYCVKSPPTFSPPLPQCTSSSPVISWSFLKITLQSRTIMIDRV